MKTLKKIDIMSFAKFQTVLMAMIGLLVGVMVAFFGFIFQAFAARLAEEGASDFGMFGMGMGLAALFILPLIYAAMGFIAGVIGGALFNLVCKITGGIKVELE